MSQPTKITSGWIATDADGQQVTRETRCRRCGQVFTQAALNDRLVESWLPDSAVDRFARDVPGNWVPVYCGPCERRDLSRGDVPDAPRESWSMRARDSAA